MTSPHEHTHLIVVGDTTVLAEPGYQWKCSCGSGGMHAGLFHRLERAVERHVPAGDRVRWRWVEVER